MERTCETDEDEDERLNVKSILIVRKSLNWDSVAHVNNRVHNTKAILNQTLWNFENIYRYGKSKHISICKQKLSFHNLSNSRIYFMQSKI